jgi:hypothetical protein
MPSGTDPRVRGGHLADNGIKRRPLVDVDRPCRVMQHNDVNDPRTVAEVRAAQVNKGLVDNRYDE